MSFATPWWFNNNQTSIKQVTDVIFSSGHFNFIEYYHLIDDPNSTYSDIDYGVEQKDIRKGYEFNNSIPRLRVPFQFRAIAWGYTGSVFQLSYRFPKYDLGIEFDIPRISNPVDITLESDLYPEVLDENNIDLEWEYRAVFPKLNFEFDQPVYSDIDSLSLEFVSPYANPRYFLSTEFFSIIDKNVNLNTEYNTAYNAKLDTEYSVTVTRSSYLNSEFLIYQTKNFNIDTEFEMVYHDDYQIQLEGNVTNITTNNSIQLEKNIDTVRKLLNFEYQTIYHDNFTLSVEFNPAKITNNTNINVEALLEAETNNELNVEFQRPVEIKVPYQMRVIALAYNDVIYQFFLKAAATEYLNFETDVSIVSNNALDLELKTIKLLAEALNIETDISILSETSIDVESFIEINTNELINLEVLTSTPLYSLLNLECFAQFEADTALAIEAFIKDITHSNLFNIEVDTVIETEIELALEFILETINKRVHLEFDILDLVYYFMRKGYNIIPWLYSDAKGRFDALKNNNWDKSENITTVESGLINQLQHLGITVPNCITTTNSDFDNFAVIIDGTEFVDTPLTDKFVMFENIGNDQILVLGKMNFKPETAIPSGKAIYIYEGKYVKDPIKTTADTLRQLSGLTCLNVWDPISATWVMLQDTQDYPLYFTYNHNGKDVMMPYIFTFESNGGTITNI